MLLCSAFNTIRRDRMMVNDKWFILWVIALVMITPFSLTVIIDVIYPFCNFGVLDLKELMYSGELYDDEYSNTKHEPSLYWTIYYYFVDPGNQHMAPSRMGRVVASLVSILGIFLLNGLLVSTLIAWFDRRKERWIKGEIRYNQSRFYNKDVTLKSYSIIIGGNDITSSVVRQIINESKYILILTSQDVENFRRKLFASLTDEEQKKIIIYYGDCTLPDEIKSLHVEKAREVFILGENIDELSNNAYNDAVNMKCLQLIADECNSYYSSQPHDSLNNRKKLVCRVMFEHQTTFTTYQFSDISNKMEQYITFRPFNYYEMWAQQVFVCPQLTFDADNSTIDNNITYLPLEGRTPITADSEDRVHLIIVGMSRMGYALAVEAAHLAHYPNYVTRGRRTRITFIDKKAYQEMGFFTNRFKALFSISPLRYDCSDGQIIITDNEINRLYSDVEGWKHPLTDEGSLSPFKGDFLGEEFSDIEWEFIQGSIETPDVQQYLIDAVQQEHSLVTLAMCQYENNTSVAATLYLPEVVLEKAQQVLVYQRYSSSIVNSLSSVTAEDDTVRYSRIKPFGMASQCYSAKIIQWQEYIAEVFSEEYKNKFIELNKKVNYKPGKSATACWWSNIYNANTMWTKLRSLGYKGNNIVDDIGIYGIINLLNDLHELYEQRNKTIAKIIDAKKLSEKLAAIDKRIVLTVSELGSSQLLASVMDGKENSALLQSIDNVKESLDTVVAMYRLFMSNNDAKNMTSVIEQYNNIFASLVIDADTLLHSMNNPLEILAATEHNRWNTEQLLLRFRPPTKEEQESFMNETDEDKKLKIKDALKHNMIHVNICSWDKLSELEDSSKEYDRALTHDLYIKYKDIVKITESI